MKAVWTVRRVLSLTCCLAFNQVLLSQSSTYMYVAVSDPHAILAFRLTPDGTLIPVPGSPVPITGPPRALAASPTGQFLYAGLDSRSRNPGLAAFVVNRETGALTPVVGSPFPVPSQPIDVKVHPNRNLLYLALVQQILPYSFDALGVPSLIQSAPVTFEGGAESMALGPRGRFLYLITNSPHYIRGYSIDGTNGSLTPAPGSPTAQFCPCRLALDSSGRFLYAAVRGLGGPIVVDVYRVDSATGGLTPIAGLLGGPNGAAQDIALDPRGRFLYVRDVGLLSAYILDTTTGAATPIAGSPYPAAFGLTAAVDPGGQFLYVGSGSVGGGVGVPASGLARYAINPATGGLTLLNEWPLPGTPTDIIFGSVETTLDVSVKLVLPSRGGNAGKVTVQVGGSGFQAGARPTLSGGGTQLIGINTVVINSGVLTTTFELSGLPPGLRDLVITNPDGSSATLSQAFTVEQGGAPQIWIDVLGFPIMRTGRPQAFYLVYGNRGNVDAKAAHIWVSVPGALTWKVESGPQPTASEILNNGSVLLGFDTVPVAPGSAGTIVLILQAPLSFTTPFQLRAWTN